MNIWIKRLFIYLRNWCKTKVILELRTMKKLNDEPQFRKKSLYILISMPTDAESIFCGETNLSSVHFLRWFLDVQCAIGPFPGCLSIILTSRSQLRDSAITFFSRREQTFFPTKKSTSQNFTTPKFVWTFLLY